MIVSLSFEMFAGIAIISTAAFNRLDEPGKFDYSDVLVRNNLIDNLGARIHISIALGGSTWSSRNKGKIIVGASVTDNTITGGAGAYGIIVNGVEGCTVIGNISTAAYSGIADGMPEFKPEEPAAFLYDPKNVTDTELQDDFEPAQRHLVHMLRNSRNKFYPLNSKGCRIVTYGDAESKAIVTAAFVELLQRKPGRRELDHWANWLTDKKAIGDDLRESLARKEEFKKLHGAVNPENIRTFRIKQWQKKITHAVASATRKKIGWPDAKKL